MTNWTKGPWVANTDGWVYDAKNEPVCLIEDGGFSGVFENARADAHLIAAAPELYEALDGIVKELMHDCPSNLKPELRDAIAAISKARGEAQ